MRILLAAIVVAALAGGSFALLDRGDSSRAVEAEPVRIGAGGDGEAVLLANLLAELLLAERVPAELVALGHARDVRQALELREIDLAPSYTGAVYLDELGWTDPPGDLDTSYERVSQADARRGLVWLGPTRVNATFAFVVSGPPSRTAALEAIDDLALAVNTDPTALLCVDPDIAERPDGFAELARIYGIHDEVLTGQVVAVAPEDAVAGVTHGGCIAGLTTATDGRAWAAGLRPLLDTRRTFPAFVAAAVATERLVEDRPEVEEALRPFRELTTEMLAELNARIALGETVETVAEDAAATLRLRAEGRLVTGAV